MKVQFSGDIFEIRAEIEKFLLATECRAGTAEKVWPCQVEIWENVTELDEDDNEE